MCFEEKAMVEISTYDFRDGVSRMKDMGNRVRRYVIRTALVHDRGGQRPVILGERRQYSVERAAPVLCRTAGEETDKAGHE